MNMEMSIVVQAVIFFILDFFIFIKTVKNNRTKESAFLFNHLAFTAAGAEFVTIFYSMAIYKIIYFNEFWMCALYTSLMFFLCFSSYFWYEYLICSIKLNKKRVWAKKIIALIPVAVVTVLCGLSYWTHTIFVLKPVDGYFEYGVGNYLLIQVICCYSYFVAGLISVVVWAVTRKDEKNVKFVKYFAIFFLASYTGNMLQLFLVDGGYIQIGVSVGMLLIYLEMYIDDIKENARLRGLDDVNKRLQKTLLIIEDLNQQLKEKQAILEHSNLMMEYQLKRSELRMNTVAEAIHGGFKTGKNDEVFTFNYVSEQLASMLGYTVPEFLEASKGCMAGIVNLDDVAVELPKARENTKKGEMYEMNYRMRCKDGSWKYVEDRGKLINLEGAEAEYWSFIIDKDELVKTEKALESAERSQRQLAELNDKLEEAREEAEAANNAKTAFLFNMSHDIRTPMNAIIGFTDLLKKHQDEPEKRMDYLKKIEDSSTVLLSIINNVLEMARIEKGTIELVETAWSAEQFAESISTVFDDMMKQKNITFTKEFNVTHNYVFCDHIKLREVFLNIVSNAYKYTKPNGKILFRVDELPCEKEGYVLYRTTVTDTGIGMSKDFQKRIFDEFSREYNTTENKIEGTGLGMAIVKRLVKFMDGTIEVESTKGAGTSVCVTVPHRIAEKSNFVNHAGVEVDPKLFEGKRILLAEDNELNAEIATEILKEAGFIIERAADGETCVDMVIEAEESYYDLILMDVQMPGMDGYLATKTIRNLENNKKAKIPILAMTANAFEEDKREAFIAGMNGHVAKPIDVHELMQELAILLSY